MSKIEFEYIYEQVDLKSLPKIKSVSGDDQVTVGDLHGNALKLIYILIRHGFVSGISEDNYHDLVEIYNQKNRHLDGEDLDKFDAIICKMKIVPQAKNAKLRLLGDELADRGSNDYFTLKILQRLHKINVRYEIIYSNHSFEFLRAYELYQREESEFSQVAAKCRPTPSLENLQDLIDEELVDLDEIKDIIETAYKPQFKLISYTLNQSANEITINSHAPIDINIIKEAAYELKVDFDDSTPVALATTIDNINEAFSELVIANEVSNTVEHDSALHAIMWNRDLNILDRRSRHNGYHVNYVHGHTGGPTDGNVVNLDNNLGKSRRNHKGEYTALVRSGQHLLATMIRQPKGDDTETLIQADKDDFTLFDDHYYPTRWIEAYDAEHEKDPWNKFECRTISRDETVYYRLCMIYESYFRSELAKNQIPQQYIKQIDLKPPTKVKSALGVDLEQETPHYLWKYIDDLNDIKPYVEAFQNLYEYDIRNHTVSQVELNKWLELKENGAKVPPVLLDAYDTLKQEEEHLVVEKVPGIDNIKQLPDDDLIVVDEDFHQMEPIIVKQGNLQQRVQQPINDDVKSTENHADKIQQLIYFTLAHPGLTSAIAGLTIAVGICTLIAATGGLGLIATAAVSMASGLITSGLSFWTLQSSQQADNKIQQIPTSMI